MELEAGVILLAEPFSQDEHFSRSVVLICHLDEEDGAFGFILNKGISSPVENNDHPLASMPFFLGGPMEQDTLFYIHHYDEKRDANPVRDGLFWQGKFEDLLESLTQKEFRSEKCRLLMGYSGWKKGQLESEIEREDWMIYNGSISEILSFPAESMWKEILRGMGPYYRMVSNFPLDPGLN